MRFKVNEISVLMFDSTREMFVSKSKYLESCSIKILYLLTQKLIV